MIQPQRAIRRRRFIYAHDWTAGIMHIQTFPTENVRPTNANLHNWQTITTGELWRPKTTCQILLRHVKPQLVARGRLRLPRCTQRTESTAVDETTTYTVSKTCRPCPPPSHSRFCPSTNLFLLGALPRTARPIYCCAEALPFRPPLVYVKV
jgi:hypothetical protein